MRNLPMRYKILGAVYPALLVAACIYVPIQVSNQYNPWQAWYGRKWLWKIHGFNYQGMILPYCLTSMQP